MAKFKRKLVQFMLLISTNGYFKGFLDGSTYRGKLKSICVPGLNCYSCPGAFGACPIGSLQAVASDLSYRFSFYLAGFLTLMGITMGRFICGWLCPFGYIQELLHKIPSPKFKVGKRFQNLKYLKYIILLVFVILLPMFWVNALGMGSPTFCKYICPAGTLEGGIPLTLLDTTLRSAAGFLFAWKVCLLIVTIFASIIIFRPFCRFVCPLGAIYSLFNPISVYRFKIDKNKCTSCGICIEKCKMGVEVYKKPNSPECIRCGECKSSCPQGAIKVLINMKDEK
ncbi:putative electron transport protein YccM [Desulfosporosinus acididurans]|uniref:Putative electron transport protein YccM n=1 Tax=Desulfosporosinus acididurans TaxID=476652 RepID=A0A0J1IKQ0_9FIRM|nr:putative electron transport protein YccM [Desulfosporosinus acididurans]